MLTKVVYLIFSVFLLSLPAKLSAQAQITGTVSNAQTKELMFGVNVVIKETQQGIITNNNGEFALPVKQGNYTVVFSYLGYKSVTRTVTCSLENPQQVLQISLIQSAKEINEVVVTAKSKAREIREMAMPTSVISMKEIQGTVSNVNEVLAKTAGVTMRNTGGTGSTSRISVRGLEGKRIGLFIDGLPINDNTNFIDVNDIPVDMIDRIEIYKGIVPAKFGGNTMGGAVNIVIREYPPMYVDIGYSIASFNTHQVNTVFKKNNSEKGYRFGVGAFYTYSDNNYKMELPLQKGVSVVRDHDNFNKKVIGGSFKATKWWFDEIEIEPSILFTEKEIQGIEYNIQEAKQFSDAYVLENKITKNNFITEGLDFEAYNIYGYSIFRFKDKAMNRYDWQGNKRSAISFKGGEIGQSPNDTYNQRHTFMQRTNLNYVINEKSSINLNSVYNYVKGIPQDTLKDEVIGHKTNFDSEMNSWIVGLSHEFNTSNKKFTNMLSFKHYYYSMKTQLADPFGAKTEAEDVALKKNDFGINEAIRYQFSPELLVKASFAYDIRLPAENELLGDGFLIAPSSNLEPERNYSANIGLMYGKLNGEGRLQFEANVFYMQLTNMIRFTGGPLRCEYKNFGEMRTLGAEAEVKWDATSWLYIWGNVTYQDLRDTREYEANLKTPNFTKNDRIPNIPYFFANGGFEVHKHNLFGGKDQNSRLFADCSFVEEYFHDFEKSKHQDKRIPRATTFNAGIEHSFFTQGVIIGLQANNLTNKKVFSEFNRPLPGRNFALKVRYIWQK